MDNKNLVTRLREAAVAAKRKKHAFSILIEAADEIEAYEKVGTPRTIVRFANELDELGLSAVVLTYDHLAWQAGSSIDGFLYWNNVIDGGVEEEITSLELRRRNEGKPFTVIHVEE